MKAAGRKQVTVFLPKELTDEIDQFKETHGLKNRAEGMAALLTQALAAQSNNHMETEATS